ncbi:hypothetical protein IW261DRAFT_1422434 [Armillaria novae-zelandiae]|uniref:F-box domain-containing protein n=1 Tax=Armillaria novae-zelandiae TaxID=153914 RepID=A0AA39UDX0_9AGAR|nr:hypothetical protein IW261DRAFT_1422434 [Armillaria novae-zelandiae]
MSPLLKLPLELLEAISKNLSVDDLKNFRASCRRIRDASARIIYSCLAVDVVGQGYQKTIEMLRALSSAHPAVTRVRHLKIVTLSEWCNVYPAEYTVFDMKLRHGCLNHSLPSETASFNRALQIALPNAIAALSHLKSLTLYTCNGDARWALDLVINSVVGHIALQEFSHFALGEQANLLPFITQAVTNLNKFSLSSYRIHGDSDLIPALIEIISMNHALSSLELDICTVDGSRKCFNTGIPADVSLPLARLVLGEFDVTIDDRLMNHFGSLTELRLGYTTSFSGADQYTPNLWAALQINSIFLKHISIASSHISTRLMEYLNSYCGLEELEFQHPSYNISDESPSIRDENNLADELFSSIIPKHSQSLRTLMVFSHLEYPWQFSVTRSAILAQCCALIKLGVCVERGIPGMDDSEESDGDEENSDEEEIDEEGQYIPGADIATNIHNIVRDVECLVRMAENLPSLEGLWIAMERVTSESICDKYVEEPDDLPDRYAALQYGLENVTPGQREQPLKIFIRDDVFVAKDGAWIIQASGPSRAEWDNMSLLSALRESGFFGS